MSASQSDRTLKKEYNTKHEKNCILSQMKSQNSLFSEIMKNHNDSSQNTPVYGDKRPEMLTFDVKDVPLPLMTNQSKNTNYDKSIKLEKMSKKIYDKTEENIQRKRRHCEQKIKRLPIITKELAMPKMCERRTHNRQGSTWGERSVMAFKIVSEVGEGTYGHVFKAIDRVTNTVKALKKVRLENEKEGFPITTVREIKILQQLNHQNIVRLHEVVTDYDLNENLQKDRKDKGFYLVFEYMDHDLYGIIDSGITLSELQIASIMKQILEGISYSHSKMFLHRDIKCSNILINNRGEVKIADYGLSRRFFSDHIKRPYTNKVITLWYRAPELLLGEECYGTSIDMWSIGCIMGELFTHRTMFTANTEMEQLDVISRVCGTPSTATWPDVSKLPLFQTYRPKYSNKRRLKEYYFTVPSNALDVLDWLLQLDPKRRCSADQAIRSYWLSKIDPRKIAPPQLPVDGDYHELACKRRHKQTRSDTGYKSCSKSSNTVKEVQKSSSSDGTSIPPPAAAPAAQTNTSTASSFQLPDDMLSVLNEQLLNIIPDSAMIKQLLLDSCTVSESGGGGGDDNNNINEKLESLLEPYIRQMLSDREGSSNRGVADKE